MKKVMLSAALVVIAGTTSGQISTPNASQHATVSQTIGTTEIEIEYHRPGVKERVIWGGLVPYDQPWRMGANAPTSVSFSDDVIVEGVEVAAGEYSMLTIPTEDSWTIILNQDPAGAFGYDPEDPEDNMIRFEVRPERSDYTEWMRFTIDPVTPESAVIRLEWENLAVPIEVNVDVDALVWKQIDSALASAYSSGASWALTKGERLEDGLEWIDAAMAISGESIVGYWNRARILNALDRNREAMVAINKAIEMAEEASVSQNFMTTLEGTRQAIRDAM